MPSKSPSPKSRSSKSRSFGSPAAKARQSAYRERLREQGLRPVQHWVPDLRKPDVRAAISAEAARLRSHPENDVLDDWLEAVIDWNDAT